MNQDQIINAIQTIMKIGGSLLIARGTVTGSQWQDIVGGVLALWGIYASHQSNASTPAPAAPFIPQVVKAVALALCIAPLVVACHLNPSAGHIIRIVGTGGKLGITQNPVSGVYELGFQRVQSELTFIPVFETNGHYSVPDAVLRYEANAHSSIFGNSAVTSTMATGTNACATAIGGASLPINIGTGTSNNLQTALPK
jgi:hypothetical protein